MSSVEDKNNFIRGQNSKLTLVASAGDVLVTTAVSSRFKTVASGDGVALLHEAWSGRGLLLIKLVEIRIRES